LFLNASPVSHSFAVARRLSSTSTLLLPWDEKWPHAANAEEDVLPMKLVYATDLHGDAGAYTALADLAENEAARAVLLGGDLFAYSPTAAPQLAFAEGPLRRFLERLGERAVTVLAIWGNVDRPAAVERLRDFEEQGLLRLLRVQPYQLAPEADSGEGVAIVGYPFVPPTLFRLKDQERRDLARERYLGLWPFYLSPLDGTDEPVEARAETLDHWLSIEEELATVPPIDEPCLLVAHSPPWCEALDLVAPETHAGSRAVRAWIEERQPLLSLHGHLHGAPDLSGRWWERIDVTLCINPGPSSAEALQAVVLETRDLPGSLRHTCRSD
jgi:Icc-related predicted phosphoesterase